MHGMLVVLVIACTASLRVSAQQSWAPPLVPWNPLDSLWSFPESFTSGPAYPIIFDDMDYVDHYSVPRTADIGFRDREIFGVNNWVILQGGATTVKSGVAWYPHEWIDPDWMYNSWFENDNNGYNILGSMDSRAIINGPVFDDIIPGTVRMSTVGSFVKGSTGPSMRSGFMARTGTWIVRARLPQFSGLRYHQPGLHGAADGLNTSMTAAPLWGQSFWAIENNILLASFTEYNRWYEFNFEIWNTPFHADPANYNYANPGDNPIFFPETDVPVNLPPMATGLYWAKNFDLAEPANGIFSPYAQSNDWSPFMSEQGNTQKCYVRTTPSSASYVNQSRCFDILTNGPLAANYTAGDPVFAYFVVRVTPVESQFSIVAYDETDSGHRENIRSNFDMLYMDTDVYDNHVVPPGMASYMSLFMYCHNVGNDGAASCDAGDLNRTMEIDWFMYTPEYDRNFEEMIGDIWNIKVNYLGAQRSLRSGIDYVNFPMRINTVSYNALRQSAAFNNPVSYSFANINSISLASGYVPGGEAYSNRCGFAARPDGPSGFDVEISRVTRDYHNDNVSILSLVQLHDENFIARRSNVRVFWNIDNPAPYQDISIRDSGFTAVINQNDLHNNAAITVTMRYVDRQSSGALKANRCGRTVDDVSELVRQYVYLNGVLTPDYGQRQQSRFRFPATDM